WLPSAGGAHRATRGPARRRRVVGCRPRRSVRPGMGPGTTRQIRASPRRTEMVRLSTTPLDGGALRRRLANGETTVGTFVGMASATATEVFAAAGADWVLSDLEHGAGSEDVIRDSVLAAGSYGVPVVVRVESSERIRI